MGLVKERRFPLPNRLTYQTLTPISQRLSMRGRFPPLFRHRPLLKSAWLLLLLSLLFLNFYPPFVTKFLFFLFDFPCPSLPNKYLDIGGTLVISECHSAPTLPPHFYPRVPLVLFSCQSIIPNNTERYHKLPTNPLSGQTLLSSLLSTMLKTSDIVHQR